MNHYNIIIFEIIIYPLIPYLHNNLSDQNLKIIRSYSCQFI